MRESQHTPPEEKDPFCLQLHSHISAVKLDTTRNKQDARFLNDLTELIEAGKVTPVIDRTYPLSKAPEAIRYLEEGHTRGKIVVTL